MNKADIIEAIRERGYTDTKVQTEQVVESVFEIISDAVANGDRVSVAGFGIFDRKHMSAREARNPRTGETVQVSARNKFKFTPAKALKEKIQ
jgi:DNA-binding protein HU-beta